MKAIAGKTYAQIVNGRCHKIYTSATLPEWNENDITMIDVTDNVPNEGDVYSNGVFSPYIPPTKTQAQINAEVDVAIRKVSIDTIPDVIRILTGLLGPGADKGLLTAATAQIDAEKAKKK